MIIFFGAGEVLFLLVMLIVLISASFDMLMTILHVLFIICVLSSLIQTVCVGYFARHHALGSTIKLLLVDGIRIAVFFNTLKDIGGQIQSQSGLGYIFSLCVFAVYFLMFGGVFGLGEIYTFIHMDQGDAVPLWPSVFCTLGVIGMAVVGYLL